MSNPLFIFSDMMALLGSAVTGSDSIQQDVRLPQNTPEQALAADMLRVGVQLNLAIKQVPPPKQEELVLK